MEFNEYQEAANRTLYGTEQVLTNCALGLAGESGQVIDLVKAYTFKGQKLDNKPKDPEKDSSKKNDSHKKEK